MASLGLRAVEEEEEAVRRVGAEVVVGVAEEARGRQSLSCYYETLSTSLSLPKASQLLTRKIHTKALVPRLVPQTPPPVKQPLAA